MKKLSGFFALMVLLLVPSLSWASLIDFEAYIDAQNLNGVRFGWRDHNQPDE